MRAMVYLHIGLHKTGTTSIQQTMYESRETLLAHGINYLAIDANHGPIIISMLSDAPDKDPRNIRRFIDTPAKARVYNTWNRRRLKRELRRNRSPKFLISGEGLSGLKHEKILALKKLLDPYASGYRIIVYARDPYGFANSASLQRLKSGAVLGRWDRKMPLPNHKRKLEKYIRVFGRENVDIRLFDPGRWVNNDLVSDFLVAIGEKAELRNELNVVRANQSMSHEAAMILSETNIAVPASVKGLANRNRASGFHLYIAEIKGEKHFIDPETYQQFGRQALVDSIWLNRTIGEQVFRKTKPNAASAPRWSATTVESIREVVRKLAAGIEDVKTSGDFDPTWSGRLRKLTRWFSKPGHSGAKPNRDPYAPIVVPAGLEWLEDDVRNPTADKSQPLTAMPTFDQPMIRSVGCFIHDLALTLQQLKADRRLRAGLRLGRRRMWDED